MSGPDFLLFLLLSLSTYGIQRIVTSDDWPPSIWFRQKVDERYGPESGWATFFHCGWCFGFWVAAAVFASAWWLLSIPYPILQLFASRPIVGYLSSRED